MSDEHACSDRETDEGRTSARKREPEMTRQKERVRQCNLVKQGGTDREDQMKDELRAPLEPLAVARMAIGATG